jgi:hypothetical protein
VPLEERLRDMAAADVVGTDIDPSSDTVIARAPAPDS